ncbi:MAG: BamA/TamA family outer membrane protein [Melioribacteraceae bacterium]|nr:BamA/TamA family outer membrane protein [Melioribacteraceae bacterium]
MRNSLFIILFSITLFYTEEAHSQITDTLKTDNSSIFLYPYVFYTPETEFALGGGGIIYFTNPLVEKAKPSKFVPYAYYTTNKQILAGVIGEHYLFENTWLISGILEGGKLVKKFYGAGGNTLEIDNSDYSEKYLLWQVAAQKIFNNVLAGLTYQIEYHDVFDLKNNPNLVGKNIVGSKGGFSSGFGFKFSFDTRDNNFYPRSGIFLDWNSTIFTKDLGSDYDYNTQILNLRGYKTIFPLLVLAAQSYIQLAGGHPPFYSLPPMGGEKIMRGYFLGRYRDKKLFALQTELRFPIFWRIKGAAFFGIGDVAGDFESFKLTNLKYSYGGGLRFKLEENEELNLRVDLGFGKNTSGIYFGVEEAF